MSSFRLPDDCLRSARFNDDGSQRLTLTRAWQGGGPHILWIGHNASKAGRDREDMTSLRWAHFTDAFGYRAYVAVNLYPFAATDVDDCYAMVDGASAITLDDNIEVVCEEAKRASMLFACWGALPRNHLYVEHFLRRIAEQLEEPKPIYCLGVTAMGAPIHPMARGRYRVPDDAQPQVWRA